MRNVKAIETECAENSVRYPEFMMRSEERANQDVRDSMLVGSGLRYFWRVNSNQSVKSCPDHVVLFPLSKTRGSVLSLRQFT
jgi:hypothetical protein